MAAIIYAGTAVFFIVYLSAERQWWDAIPQSNRTDFKSEVSSLNSEEVEKL